MKPTEKSPEIDNLLTSLFGVDRRKSITENICVECKKPAVEFRDETSRREFSISGLCAACQEKVFGVDNDDDL